MMQKRYFRSQGKPVFSRRRIVWLGLLLAWFGVGNVSALPVNVNLSVNVSLLQTATFTVVATQIGSLSPLHVQWRRNGQNIPGQLTLVVPVLGVATSLLTLNNIQPTDGGAYSAVVFDDQGAATSISVDLPLSNLTSVLAGNLFSQRGTLNSALSGTVGANNTSATGEPGEPMVAGKKGGATVWLKWVAPNSGIAQLDTRGSDFDTTLGVYMQADARFAVSITNLYAVAGDDDSGNYFNSAVAFNAVSNREYEIAVDGFYGAQGKIVLNWALSPSASAQIPVLTNQPVSLTVTNGANVSFTVDDIQNAEYQWYLNDVPIPGQTRFQLPIPSVTPANVGQYKVRVGFASGSVFSEPAHLQINFQGNSSSAAQSKFHEATDPTIAPRVVFHPNAVPVSGFTGTQIYSTYGAASEPGEPNHCGKVGGAPYWFSYLAPANGNLTVDAFTPTFTNVVAVYTWSGGDFSGLNPVACASTNNGVGHETAVFPAANGTTYYLVVDGLNGAVGNVTLNYTLVQPVAITVPPQSQTVSPGSNVTLTVTATGGAPLAYQWRTNAANFQGQTNASLTVANFQSAKEGNYDVVVTNLANAVTSSVATLYLNSPPRFGGLSFSVTGGFSATLLGIANTNYLLQTSTNLATTNWLTILTNQSPVGIIPITDTNNFPARFYRAVPK